MNPYLIGAGYIALCAWVISLLRGARRADEIAAREARRMELAEQEFREQERRFVFRQDVDRRSESDRQLVLLEAAVNAPPANVVPITQAPRFQKRPAGGAAA